MFYAVQQSEHTETLVVGLFQKSQLTGKALEIDEMLEGHLTQLLKEGDVSAKPNQVSKVFPPSSAGMKRIYFVGLGREAAIIRLNRRRNVLLMFFKPFIKIENKKLLSCLIRLFRKTCLQPMPLML